MMIVEIDSPTFPLITFIIRGELKNEGLQSSLEESRKRPGLGRRTTFKQIFCSSRKDSTYVQEMLDCIVCSSFDVCVIHPGLSPSISHSSSMSPVLECKQQVS